MFEDIGPCFALCCSSVPQLDSVDHQCIFKHYFSPQLPRATAASIDAAAIDFSGQMIGDIGRHASRRNSGGVSGHISANKGSTVIRSCREGHAETHGVMSSNISWRKPSCTCVQLCDVPEQGSGHDRRHTLVNRVTYLSQVLCKARCTGSLG